MRAHEQVCVVTASVLTDGLDGDTFLGEGGCDRCEHTGLVRDAQIDQNLKGHMSIVEQKVRSILAVPLQTNDQVIGLIYLDQPNHIRDFSREDLNLLTVMANVAAIRIEHARLNDIEAAEKVMAKEMEQAAQIQQRLFPDKAPQAEGVDIAARAPWKAW